MIFASKARDQNFLKFFPTENTHFFQILTHYFAYLPPPIPFTVFPMINYSKDDSTSVHDFWRM